MTFVRQHFKIIFILLIFATGLILNLPYFNYQNYLSQGDHGRDLYAFQAVYRGEWPYRDFWWVYGPLMPYYYGAFNFIFGNDISSILFAESLLRILNGILIGLCLIEITSTAIAYAGACWYLLFAQDFFFTYNHIGGITMILGVILCLLKYIRHQSPKAALSSLVFIFALCLIKINFGIIALIVFLLTTYTVDVLSKKSTQQQKSNYYTLALIGLPLAVFFIYFTLLHGLSIREIRQCMPYMEGDEPYNTSPLRALGIFFQLSYQGIVTNGFSICFAILILISTCRSFFLWVTHKIESSQKINLGISILMLILFFVANLHEFLKSGVWYRSFWSEPVGMLLIFISLDICLKSLSKVIQKFIYVFLAIIFIYQGVSLSLRINSYKTPGQLLNLPKANIYIRNAPDWIQTVTETTQFLNKTLKSNELFFALPYDCLYYYLTDRKSPTRQLIFFDHIKIDPDQEKQVIADLERNHVHYIVVSNRSFALKEHGLGILGQSYCPLIGNYINTHFAPIARFGDWTHEPGWAWNHGTIVFKRK